MAARLFRVVVNNGPSARVPVYLRQIDAEVLADWEACSPAYQASIRTLVRLGSSGRKRARALLALVVGLLSTS
jgi:hypothetical protein